MAHIFINKSQVNAQTANPTTHDHTPGAAATLAILSIVVQGTSARAGGSPTIGGTTATQLETTQSSSEHQVEVWYVCKAFSGSLFSVSIPNTGGLTLHVEVVTADAGTGFESVLNDGSVITYTAGTEDGGQLDVTSAASGDFLYCRMVNGEAAVASVAETSTNPTKILSYSNDHGAYTSFGYYAVSDGAGTESFVWTWSNDVAAIVGGAWRSATAVADLSVSVYDSAAVSENVSEYPAQLFTSHVDSVAVVESLTNRLAQLFTSHIDSVLVAEDVAVAKTLLIDTFDSIATSESVGIGKVLTIDTYDAANVGENLTVPQLPIGRFSISEWLNLILQETSYLLSTTDAIAVEEQLSLRLAQLFTSHVDSADIQESISILIKQLFISTSDSIGVSETLSERLAQLFISISDDLGVVDAPSAEVTAVGDVEAEAEDSVGVTDVNSQFLAQLFIDKLDSFGFSESVLDYVNKLFASSSDDLSVAESISTAENLRVSVSDSIGVEESQSQFIAQLIVSIQDDISISENVAQSLGAALPLSASTSDPTSISDEPKLYRSPMGEFRVTEWLNAYLQLVGLTLVVQDDISASDVFSGLTPKLFISSIDNVGVSEFRSVTKSRSVAIVDGVIGLSEAVAIALQQRLISTSDAIDIIDQASILLKQLFISTSDSIGVGENISLTIEQLAALTTSLSDLSSISDEPKLSRYPMGEFKITDLVSLSLQANLFNISVVDNIDVSANIELIPLRFDISKSDLISTVESVIMRLSGLYVNVADIINASDVVEGAYVDPHLVIFSEFIQMVVTGQAPRSVSKFDSTSISETISLYVNKLNASVVDSIQLSEAVDMLNYVNQLFILTSDDIDVVDSDSELIKQLLINLFDDVAISDEASASAKLDISTYDLMSVDENLLFLGSNLNVSTYDTADVSDEAEALVAQLCINKSDAIEISDVASTYCSLYINVEDQIYCSENVAQYITKLYASSVDSVDIADSTNVYLYSNQIQISVNDLVGITDVDDRYLYSRELFINSYDSALISESTNMLLTGWDPCQFNVTSWSEVDGNAVVWAEESPPSNKLE